MRIRIVLMCAILGLTWSMTAFGVKPKQWSHRTEADFSSGEADQVIFTNLGEVKLAREGKSIAELEGKDAIVYDLARTADGTIWIAGGPEGKLLKIEGDKAVMAATYPGAQVFCLSATNKGLWVGVSAADSKLEFRTGPKMEVQRTIDLKGVRYVWEILVDGPNLWVGTGTDGKVLLIGGDGKPVTALATKQKNILCLGRAPNGTVYAGTDGEGLVYSIKKNGDKFETFVAYDAAEPEIGAMYVTPDGTVYAGTADANQARPGRLAGANAELKGRIEKDAEREPGKIPNVPDKPMPKDGPAKPATPPGDKPMPEKPATPAETKPMPMPMPEKPAADKPAEDGPKPKPTPQQYDALREAVKKRLEEAGKTGRIDLQQAPAGPSKSPFRPTSTGPSSSSSGPAARGSRGGNAIYRITPDGFVNEVFRESVMILRILPMADKLLVATGNEGQIYQVDPETEEVAILANLDPQQVPAMLALGEGKVLLGTANPGAVVQMTGAYPESGSLTSKPLDAGQISLWGMLNLNINTPGKSQVQIQTRTGNVGDPESGSWTDWSAPKSVTSTDGLGISQIVDSRPARFLQYKLTLKGDGKDTPSVSSLDLKYLMPNLRPSIKSVKTSYPEAAGGPRGARADAGPRGKMKIQWEAADGNGDGLNFKLEARKLGDDGPFIVIEKSIENNNYDWDTKSMPDGKYILRITATDAPDNVDGQELTSSRLSDPVSIDNTAPQVLDLKLDRTGADAAELSATVTDAISDIAEVRYSVDGGAEWKFVLPKDQIYDSTSESVVVKITALSPAAHVVSLKVTDTMGNTVHVSRSLKAAK